MAILIRSASYLVRAADRVEEDADVLVEGNRIAAVGRGLKARGATVLDARGRALIPGLINAHTHLYQNLLKGLDDDLPLVAWCDRVLFPAADIIHQDQWRWGDETIGYYWSSLGAIEMIKGGVTCCADMDLTMDSVFQAWLDAGLRGVAAVTLADRWIPEKLQRDPERLRAEALGYVERWHGAPDGSGLIRVALAPSTPFLASPELLVWAAEQASRLGLGYQMHVAETRYEVERLQRETGRTPVGYLDSLGVLRQGFVAIHCVHLTAGDIDILRRRRAVVVHNPKSNLKLGSGVAPIPRLLAAGVPVALGTDGCASNDLLDMFEEMRAAALLQKGLAEDPAILAARDVFRMATEHGALACGLDAGTIDQGRLADLVLVDLRRPHLVPVHNVVGTLVYAARAGDVETVIIDGRIVMRGRRLLTLPEEKIVARADELGRALYRRSRASDLCRPQTGDGGPPRREREV